MTASKAGAQEPALAIVALELFGMGVAPGRERRPPSDPDIGPA